MTSLVALPLALQLGVPLLLVGWVALGRPANRLAWGLTLATAALWIAATALAGLWLSLPWYLPLALAALLIPAAAASYRRVRSRPLLPAGRRGAPGVVLRGALALLAAALVARALMGRVPPAPLVELEPPLRGTWLVVNGGSNVFVNPHLETLGSHPRFRPWRGQSYGVDLMRPGAWGMPGRGLLPRDPAAYAAFGETVYAPCAGPVLRAVNDRPDLPVPEADTVELEGNHALLDCGGTWVLLAHFMRGSVRVRAGDTVSAGAPLAQVGNSGNTGAPHLHIHAQRPGTPQQPLSGEPLPIAVGGRYLVRNQRPAW